MHYKKYLHLIIALLLVTISFNQDKSCNRTLIKPTSIEEQSFGLFNVNRITSDFSNDGMFVTHLKSSKQGMEWPKYMGVGISYNSGIWIADSTNGKIRLAAVGYRSEYSPGPFGIEYDTEKHKIYTISKIDFDTPYSNSDFVNWPVDDGAPWIDNNNDGIYNVGDGDIPEMLGDQMHWYVCKDDNQENHTIFQTPSLNVELQVTKWGYDGTYNSQNLRDVMFVNTLIINKGHSNIENAYVGLWNDSDIGDAWDDWVGCDSTLNLGYCYNDGVDEDYGDTPPSLGIALLQGPIIQSNGNTARAFGREIDDFHNLPLSSFYKYT